MCHTHDLGSHAQGQGRYHYRGQILPEIVLLINFSSKFDETKVKVAIRSEVKILSQQ